MASISTKRQLWHVRLFVALWLLVSPYAEATRHALVIGVSTYEGENLTEVKSDAESVALALSSAGFSVAGGQAQLNLSRDQMRASLSKFLASLRSGDTAVFYYSGHGVEALEENYLISSDGQRGIAVESDILDPMGAITSGPKIVILDTCRRPASPEIGLSRPGALPLNSIVAYGSPPRRSIVYPSLYTKTLLNRLQEPGLEIVDLLRVTKESFSIPVTEQEQIRQRPVEYGGLTEKFYFRPAVAVAVQIHSADDDLKVLINGEQQVSWRTNATERRRVILKAGTNTLELRVHNWRTFTGGLAGLGGHLPEGWNYNVSFFDDNGMLLGRLADGEDRPAEDGPRHGQEFLAARGQMVVDPKSAKLTFKATAEKR